MTLAAFIDKAFELFTGSINAWWPHPECDRPVTAAGGVARLARDERADLADLLATHP